MLSFLKKHQYFFYILIIILLIAISYSVFITAPFISSAGDLLNPYTGEAPNWFVYGNAIVRKNLVAFHQLGLWDNQLSLGYPLIGHLSYQFYPPMWLIFFFPDLLIGTRFLVTLHLFSAGIACFYLLRVFKCPPPACVLGSCLYVINYYIQGKLMGEIYMEVYFLVWLPLAIAFLWKTLFEKKFRYAFFTGATIAMPILGMMLHTVYFLLITLCFIFIYYLVYLIIQKKLNFVNLRYIVFVSGIIILVSFGLSAIKLLPVLEFTKYSMRSDLPLYGNEHLQNGWILKTPETLLYFLTHILVPFSYNLVRIIPLDINIIFLFLIVISFLHRSKEQLFIAIITIISLVAMMGKNFPIDLYAFFYYVVPGMKTIEDPNRFVNITNLTLPLLASFGLTYIFNFKRLYPNFIRRNKTIIFIFFVFYLSLSVGKFTYGQLYKLYLPHFTLAKNDQSKKVNTTIKTIVDKEPEPVHVAANSRFQIYNYNVFKYDYLLANQQHPDFSLNYFYFPFTQKSTDKEFLRKKYILLSLMNTKYIFMDKDLEDPSNEYIKSHTKFSTGTLYQLNNSLPFIYSPSYAILLLGDTTSVDFNALEAKTLLLNNKFNTNSTSIFTDTKQNIEDYSLKDLSNFDSIILANNKAEISNKSNKLLEDYKKQGGKILTLSFNEYNYQDIRARSRSVMTTKPAKYLLSKQNMQFQNLLELFKNNPTNQTKIKMTKFTPEEIRFTLHALQEKTILKVTDAYFPGWYAFDNSKSIPVYMADGMIKGLIVNGNGKHEIVLKYQPLSFFLGLSITSITAIILILFMFNIHKTKNILLNNNIIINTL